MDAHRFSFPNHRPPLVPVAAQVSRSFAAVIRQLPDELAWDILIFYLVLRALDTIEDDMDAFKTTPQVKCDHLSAFGDKYLGNENWTMDGVGEVRFLLLRHFSGLPSYRESSCCSA